MSVSTKQLKINDIPQSELKGGVKSGGSFEFGKTFADRMFLMEYSPAAGWHDAVIKKFENFSLSPATMVLHYAQEIFEGLKAYYRVDGKIGLFRPKDNFLRMNVSAERLCMPTLDIDFVHSSLRKLIELEKNWVPQQEGTSLYIRPTMIGVDPLIKLKSSDNFWFYIILSPVGMYYKNGFNPTKIMVEDQYVRAVRGGLGAAKAGANYAASLLPGKKAVEKGYDQVLWLDGVEMKYIEEVGSMNLFFLYNDHLATSALNGSILPGITRDSVIQLSKKLGLEVREEALAIDQIVADIKDGKIKEMFGSGTAAVISPVSQIAYKGNNYVLKNEETGKFTRELYDQLTGIQYGKVEDPFGWTEII